MSITRSYNKHTGKYYAYETSYEWDETKQKKVQRKQCIGQFDPVTGKVIPNGKRGRPRKKTDAASTASPVRTEQLNTVDSLSRMMEDIHKKLSSIEKIYQSLERELHSLDEDITRLKNQCSL